MIQSCDLPGMVQLEIPKERHQKLQNLPFQVGPRKYEKHTGNSQKWPENDNFVIFFVFSWPNLGGGILHFFCAFNFTGFPVSSGLYILYHPSEIPNSEPKCAMNSLSIHISGGCQGEGLGGHTRFFLLVISQSFQVFFDRQRA